MFLQFCKTFIPCSKILIILNDKPWFTSELRYMYNIRIRNRQRKEHLYTHSVTDFRLYNIQRNKVNSMTKCVKDNYDNNVTADIFSNTERVKSNSDTVIPPLKTSVDDYAFTDIEKASMVNDYFCTISSVDDYIDDYTVE